MRYRQGPSRPQTEAGYGQRSAGIYPCGLLLGVQQRCVEAGRQAGSGKDLLEWDLGFPQEPEKTKKANGENQPIVPGSSTIPPTQLQPIYLGLPLHLWHPCKMVPMVPS